MEGRRKRVRKVLKEDKREEWVKERRLRGGQRKKRKERINEGGRNEWMDRWMDGKREGGQESKWRKGKLHVGMAEIEGRIESGIMCREEGIA